MQNVPVRFFFVILLLSDEAGSFSWPKLDVITSENREFCMTAPGMSEDKGAQVLRGSPSSQRPKWLGLR